MNKQEAIEKIEKRKSTLNGWEELTRNRAFNEALDIVRKIDEPQKVTVPKFVGEWIEEMKQNERPLYSVMSALMNKINHEWDVWKSANMNFSEIVAQAWIYGYTVKKEKLYTVEIPNPNGDSNRYGLCKVDGKIIVGSFVFGLDRANNAKLTESEIKQDFEWAWQWAKEVE